VLFGVRGEEHLGVVVGWNKKGAVCLFVVLFGVRGEEHLGVVVRRGTLGCGGGLE
jgi:hypothetical protein